MVHVFRSATEAGIGRQRVRSKIVEVSDGLNGPAFWSGDDSEYQESRTQSLASESPRMPERCTLRWRFCTPVQIVRDGKAVEMQLIGETLAFK